MTVDISQMIDKTIDSIQLDRLNMLIRYILTTFSYYIRRVFYAILEWVEYTKVQRIDSQDRCVIWRGRKTIRFDNSDFSYYLVTFYSNCVKYRTIMYCRPNQIMDNIRLISNRPSKINRTIFSDIHNIDITIDGDRYSGSIRGWNSNLTVLTNSIESNNLSNEDWVRAGLSYYLSSRSIDLSNCELDIDITTLDMMIDSIPF